MTIRLNRSQCRARIRPCTGPIALILLAGAFAPAAAQTAKPKEFVYFLPKTQVSVDVSQRLLACPQGLGGPEVATTIKVTSETIADPEGKVVLDASSGTFADRTVKIELNPDGTLQSFNSQSTGQGAKVLTALANAAFKIAPMAFGLPGPAGLGPAAKQPSLVCTDVAKGLLKSLGEISGDIAALEAQIVSGSATAGETELLGQRRNQRAQIIQALTLSTGTSEPLEPARGTGKSLSPALIDPVPFAKWFSPTGGGTLEQALDSAQVAGRRGFKVTLTPDQAMYNALQTAMSLPGDAAPNLIYRRPVPATVTVEPCASRPAGQCFVDGGPNAAGATGTAAVRLPQLSGYFTIPVGRGGLFGTRQASARFDAAGAPTVLEYGSGSASADVAGLIDTAAAGTVTLRDDELADLKRQIELEEARRKLDELRNPDTTH